MAGTVTATAWLGLWQAATVGGVQPHGTTTRIGLLVVAVVAMVAVVVRKDRYDREWSRR